MSYNNEQLRENNKNSREVTKLNNELSQAKAEVKKYEESLTYAKEHVAELIERLSILKCRQNELAKSAGLVTPMSGPKATVGYHRRIRPCLEPPHTFECLTGSDPNYKKMEDLAHESLQEAFKVLTAVKKSLKREKNWCLGHSEFFASVLQTIVNQIRPGFEVTVVPEIGNQLPIVPEVISNIDLSYYGRYTDISLPNRTNTQQRVPSPIIASTPQPNINETSIPIPVPELTLHALLGW